MKQVIEQRIPAQHVWAFFQKFEKLHFEDYLDASQSQEPAQFTLSLLDCLLGIEMVTLCSIIFYYWNPLPGAHKHNISPCSTLSGLELRLFGSHDSTQQPCLLPRSVRAGALRIHNRKSLISGFRFDIPPGKPQTSPSLPSPFP